MNARKKAEKPKPKFRSYAEARKGRENFRKRLVEVRHNTDWFHISQISKLTRMQ